MSESEVQSYMDFVLPLVLESGKNLLGIEQINPEIKNGNDWDVVTIYDRKIEDLLIQKLKQKYTTHKFIGEEESSANKRIATLTNSPTWIIDPIDGTANFVKRMPITCISVGLTINKERVFGIIYNPYMNELFTAKRGHGAFLNGQRIFTSGETDIKKCIFNYELSLAIQNEQLMELYMSRLKFLINEISGIRSYGSAALGLCYVACGRIDAYQCDGLYPWDVAAGTLIVEEAGGSVVDSGGKPFDLMNPNFLASSTETLEAQFMKTERAADAFREKNKTNQFLPEDVIRNEKTK
ncbi:uncharacterized protein LOC126745410 [Anthonomus grandis grandis]|uniref:uncharacterized protein LOC126745410 n=1 Tax=Anthonomus grandis grandis TaxID=2921223 RepID=UPI002164F4B3|nr:uncharacterized protein LOC126745410 [Anthonomus grandis grandis]